MNCPKCNNVLQVKTKFCPFCGTEIDQFDETEDTIESAETTNETEQNVNTESAEQSTAYTESRTFTQAQPNVQPAPQPQVVVVQNPTNGYAIAGFVCSFFFSILGIIFSAIGLKRAKELNDTGKGLAIAGLVISIVSIAISLIITITTCSIGLHYYY